MKLFDTHTHIGLIHTDPIQQLIIVKEAKAANVNYMMSICNNIKDFFSLYDNLKLDDSVYYAIGLSPTEVAYRSNDWESLLLKGLELDKVIAVGETGLDYKKSSDKNSQIEVFLRHLEIARKADLPVIIHNREAGDDIVEILQTKLPPRGAIMHCYSEDYAFAKKLLDLNVKFSFAGNLTYRNAGNLHETAKNLPLEKILIESEAPFMVPSFHKGKRNKPSYLIETMKFLAELKGLDIEDCADVVYNNSLDFFKLK